jgi:hypothetical protein
MADIKIAYGASTALTISLASLASSQDAGRESTAVDNTANLYHDYICQVKIKLQAGTPAADRAVYIYVYGTEDGTTYTDNATGSDAAITLRNPPNAKLAQIIACPDSGALTYESQPFSIAKTFDWLLPRKWGVIVRNNTNVTFDATGGNHTVKQTGIYYTSA